VYRLYTSFSTGAQYRAPVQQFADDRTWLCVVWIWTAEQPLGRMNAYAGSSMRRAAALSPLPRSFKLLAVTLLLSVVAGETWLEKGLVSQTHYALRRELEFSKFCRLESDELMRFVLKLTRTSIIPTR
jgi:hypothetical protein